EATSDWPPASAFTLGRAARRLASAREDGRSKVNSYMVCLSSGSGLGRLDGFPHARRGGGHVELLHAERAQRVEHGVDHRGWRADRACFSAALRAELVVRA